MARNRLSSSSKVSAEQLKLEREGRIIERQRQELTKRLEKEARLAKKAEKVKMNVSIAQRPSSISLGAARIGNGRNSQAGRRRLSGKDRNAALVRFLILCLILATLVVMLWRAVPS